VVKILSSPIQHPIAADPAKRERSPVALGYGGTRPGFPSRRSRPPIHGFQIWVQNEPQDTK
jgi:hypothetical protein